MGKFHDKLDKGGDTHVIAKAQVEVWLSEFALEVSKATPYRLSKVVQEWFG